VCGLLGEGQWQARSENSAQGAVVKVLAGPTSDSDRLVDIIWEGRVVTMFVFDLTVRGTEIKDPGTEGFNFEKSARA
jgi:hypothetical protein